MIAEIWRHAQCHQHTQTHTHTYTPKRSKTSWDENRGKKTCWQRASTNNITHHISKHYAAQGKKPEIPMHLIMLPKSAQLVMWCHPSNYGWGICGAVKPSFPSLQHGRSHNVECHRAQRPHAHGSNASLVLGPSRWLQQWRCLGYVNYVYWEDVGGLPFEKLYAETGRDQLVDMKEMCSSQSSLTTHSW